jgi:squalene synthase HpnC
MSAAAIADVADLASGKGHKDENFPVASVLIAPRHRPAVMAFYRFARAADDVSDSPTATPATKLALLETMRATLAGESDENPESLALRRIQEERGIDGQHGLDLLEAFRRDVTKLRYADWGELMDYCRYSAAPVGRFVLDVHGESRTTWPANDALCSALQVINHLQDCAKDYRDLDRCYLPLDMLAAAGVSVDDLSAPAASPGLRRVIADLARQTGGLLAQSRAFAGEVRDVRLGVELAVIQRLAQDLNRGLMRRDPLSEPVHHKKSQVAGLALAAAAGFAFHRIGRPKPLSAGL